MAWKDMGMDLGWFTAWVGNSLSAGAILGTLLGILPPIAATIAILWYLIQIYESKTVQNYLRRRRARKVAKLKYALMRLEESSTSTQPK